MSAHLKLWTGIGLYVLVGGAGIAQAEGVTQPVGNPREVSGWEAPWLVAQANPDCRPIAVEGGGEGGEGGEGSGPSIPVITLAPEQHFQDPQIILDFVDQVVIPNYEQLAAETQDLSAAVQAFVETPDETKLEAARQTWFTARITWEESEAFAFGPA
ncbi:MAG: imelysin family protein, partial [Thermostichus sp. BF3_bins_97]